MGASWAPHDTALLLHEFLMEKQIKYVVSVLCCLRLSCTAGASMFDAAACTQTLSAWCWVSGWDGGVRVPIAGPAASMVVMQVVSYWAKCSNNPI